MLDNWKNNVLDTIDMLHDWLLIGDDEILELLRVELEHDRDGVIRVSGVVYDASEDDVKAAIAMASWNPLTKAFFEKYTRGLNLGTRFDKPVFYKTFCLPDDINSANAYAELKQELSDRYPDKEKWIGNWL